MGNQNLGRRAGILPAETADHQQMPDFSCAGSGSRISADSKSPHAGARAFCPQKRPSTSRCPIVSCAGSGSAISADLKSPRSGARAFLPAETADHQQMSDCLLRRIRFADLCGLEKSARRYLLSKIGQGRVVLLRRVNRNESGSNQADPEKARNSAISSTHSQSG